MRMAFKFRANPTRRQEQWLFAELRHQKQLQNYMLQMRSQMWEYGSKSVSMYDQINHLAKLRAANSHYSKHPQDMQVSTIKRVNAAHSHFHQVPPHHTSQTCSECCQKSEVKLKLSERLFHCKSCGLKLDRDHNAALNILHRAACALRGEVWDAILTETRNQLLQLACWG